MNEPNEALENTVKELERYFAGRLARAIELKYGSIHLQLVDDLAVIPPHPRRKEQREYDKHLYKERHLVECFINKIKHYRRLFSRFEKYASRYLGFLNFTGALIWLR